MPGSTPATRLTFRPLALIAVVLTGVLVSGALGAVTNAISGRDSPLDFRTIMHWPDVDDVWRASIAQGIFEGLPFGVRSV